MRHTEHLGPELLQDFAEDRLDARAARRVRSHLESGCGSCTHELRFWARALGALQVDRGLEVPEEVLARAFALFDRLAPRPTPWERVVATLAFDSRVQPAMAGARDAAPSAFQLLFTAQGTDVDLLCEREQEGWQITGQALAPGVARPDAGALWRVAAMSPAGRAEAEADSLGMFRLRHLAPGVYDLILRSANREILLPNVELQAN